MICWFVTRNLADCVNFMQGEDSPLLALLRGDRSPKPMRRYYQVEAVSEVFWAPMALVDEVHRRLIHGGPVEPLLDEYWHPSLKWQWLEGLVSELRIVEEVFEPITREHEQAFIDQQDSLCRLDADRNRAKCLAK